jgi:hypothetical protein
MAFTHGHALIIGVGSYQHEPRLNVPLTAADAQAVATVMRDEKHCGYPATQVTLLTNAEATRAGILAALITDRPAQRRKPPCCSSRGLDSNRTESSAKHIFHKVVAATLPTASGCFRGIHSRWS